MKKAIVFLSVFLLALSLFSCAREPVNILPAADAVLPAEEALKAAKKEDVVVVEEARCTSGKKLMDEFYAKVEEKTPASVVCAYFRTLKKESTSEDLYESEKSRYPQMTFYRITFDGESFTVTTRLSTQEKADSAKTYRYLLHMTGDMPSTAIYSTYDHYVLVDDPEATWEKIWAGLLSSHSEAPKYRHLAVYMTCAE